MKIDKLLEGIKDLELVVPEFQREYVWSLDQSKELLVSLFHEYPTGSILVWETNKPPEIKNEAVKKDKVGWVKVLLDGQQRLTTLFLLISDSIPPYYTEDDIINNPRHLYFNLKTAEFNYYQKQKMEGNPLWRSIVSCFNENFDAFSLLEELDMDESEKLTIGPIINNNLTKLRAIQKTDYHILSVPPGVNIDKAIDIFDRVNSKGTKLSDAELVLTHISGKWAQARREMKKQIQIYNKALFRFNLDFLTRCMVVVLTESALYEKMTTEMYFKLTCDDYKNAWSIVVKTFDYLIPILKQSAYLGGSDDITTNNVLVPLLANIAHNGGSFKNAPDKSNFLYWMYLALIWGRYSGQTDQRLDRDVYLVINSKNPVDDLIKEVEDQRGRIEVKPSDFEGRGAGHPLHRMLYILTKANKAIDWANGGSLQDTLGDYYSVQSHHIFPQAVLYKNGYESDNHLDKKKVNEVANRAFITRDTNYSQGSAPPNEYLPDIVAKYPDALKQHFIPEEKSLWAVDRYEDFLNKRRIMLADAINKFLEELKTESEEALVEIDYKDIIAKGENDYVEFKASMRWDYNQSQVNKLLSYIVAKTVSAFANSEGGSLFIGIFDDGKIVGLEKDYETLKKKNADGFLLHFVQTVNQYLGKEFHQYINIRIEKVASRDICVVDVLRSDMPVYVRNGEKEEFYIRASASSQPMSMREANEYIKVRWNNN